MQPLTLIRLHHKKPFQALEFDRGDVICGDAWSYNDLTDYLCEDKRNHWVGFADDDGKYVASVGISYQLEKDAVGAVVKRVKSLDHMVVDASRGDQETYLIARYVLHELSKQWMKAGQPERLRCVIHRQELAWYMFLVMTGFATVCSGEDWIQLEMEGYDAEF